MTEVLETDQYLTTERFRVQPSGIKLAREEVVTHQTQCYQHQLEYFLKSTLTEGSTKIKWDKEYRATDIYRQAKIKTQGHEDLSLMLLRRGWAQLEPGLEKTNKSYLKAQKFAQTHRLGMWGSCDNWYKLREKQRLRGKTNYLKPDSKTYLNPVSYGWISEIIEPHIYEIENGQRIELQGVRVPDPKSGVRACWRKTLLPEVERLLLGKKVRLEADHLHLSARGQRLKRYVWLEGNRWQSPILINQWLLKRNSVLLSEAELNLKYVDLMRKAAVTDVLPTWWEQCAGALVSDVLDKENEPVTVELEYDESCRIKGNVSGSKKNPKKTYHTPLSGWYKRIKAEQCFDDEASAEAEGFIKVK